MWEYRLVWTSEQPPWWEETWSHGVAYLKAHGQPVEDRPDTYLVIPGRSDIGLKLRKDEEFETKVLHQRQSGWELWEKCAFFRWNALEYARLIAFLRLTGVSEMVDSKLSAAKGSELLLRDRHIQSQKVRVSKTRIQATAEQLFRNVPDMTFDPNWLAETVQIRLPNRSNPVYSVCFETMEPLRGGVEPALSAGAICCGYPELLTRHLSGIL